MVVITASSNWYDQCWGHSQDPIGHPRKEVCSSGLEPRLAVRRLRLCLVTSRLKNLDVHCTLSGLTCKMLPWGAPGPDRTTFYGQALWNCFIFPLQVSTLTSSSSTLASTRPRQEWRRSILPSVYRTTGATPPPSHGLSSTPSCVSPLRVRTKRC